MVKDKTPLPRIDNLLDVLEDGKEVPVLGHIVGKGHLQMEATKVKTILEWEMLKNWKDVQKFNGFCNFY